MSNGGINTPMTSIFSDGPVERVVFIPRDLINASNMSINSGG